MSACSITDIDNILPQTQCGLCGYNGCKPYATAIINDDAPINLCPPGGKAGLQKLADLTGQDATPFLATMKQTSPTLAVIREDECIGCRKCINVCPVDAIVGAAKYMHTVIQDECTGCNLCVEPCPVDCIDLIEGKPLTEQQKHTSSIRFAAREDRMANTAQTEEAQYQKIKNGFQTTDSKAEALAARKAMIDEIMKRGK